MKNVGGILVCDGRESDSYGSFTFQIDIFVWLQEIQSRIIQTDICISKHRNTNQIVREF